MGCTLSVTEYPSAEFEANTVAERGLLTSLVQLNAPMRSAELDAGVVAERATLDALWDAGTPSLPSLTASTYIPVVNEALTGFVAAQGQIWTPAKPPAGPGGIYGTGSTAWIFSSLGVDLRQAIDKGLYGALFYNEAVKRIPNATTPAAIDQLLALYGAPPSFPANDGMMQPRDELMARYAKRRTQMGVGPYPRLKEAFVRARAAAAAGAVCDAERVAALTTIRTEWEKVLAGTVAYYVYAASNRLQMQSPPLAVTAQAMHDLGEGGAFVLGLRAVAAPGRLATDAQLDMLLGQLKYPSLSTATLYQLLTDSPADVDGLLAANAQLQAIYGFTPEEMTRFRTNY
jgi:hypothetical protein